MRHTILEIALLIVGIIFILALTFSLIFLIATFPILISSVLALFA